MTTLSFLSLELLNLLFIPLTSNCRIPPSKERSNSSFFWNRRVLTGSSFKPLILGSASFYPPKLWAAYSLWSDRRALYPAPSLRVFLQFLRPFSLSTQKMRESV